jgi:hypothetical protein
MRGKKLAPHTRMMVNPGLAKSTSSDAGRLIEVMVDAGATIGVPGCGPCSGCHQGMLGAGENAISTASRNFRGRNGSRMPNLRRLAGNGRRFRHCGSDRDAGGSRVDDGEPAMRVTGRTGNWPERQHGPDLPKDVLQGELCPR